MKNTSLLTLLICVNLLLLTATILVATTPRAAFAQGTGLAGNYMAVAGEIRDDMDALYLVDMRARILHTIYFRTGTNELQYGGYRLLDQDFRHNLVQP